ncbi:MAG: GntR family transcriptional regulator [Steroidobacteraceae bacterium]|jgi:DNA-binding GntR family transcriptional regulator
MKIDGKKTTVTGETYQRLRTAILSGEFVPGSKLRTDALCAQCNVSLSTVREALSQLLAEGLVVAEAHRGWIVTPVSAEDLLDLTRSRIEIENLCLSWSIEAGDLEWETQVIAAAHRLTNTSRERSTSSVPNSAWTSAHDAFHYALICACQSRRLLAIRQQLYEQSERYRILERKQNAPRDHETEHTRIKQAVLARDIDKATRLMRNHLQLTAENVLASMRIGADSVPVAKPRIAKTRRASVATTET